MPIPPKRIASNLPTPAELWARRERDKAYRQGVIELMLKDAMDG